MFEVTEKINKESITEVWKDIPGYDGFYQISNHGQVYSHKSKRIIKGSTLYAGYQYVNLCNNGVSKNISIHRLVACAFIPNPDNLPVVHHIDENPQNNSVSNLKWCTQKENVHYTIAARKHGRMSR